MHICTFPLWQYRICIDAASGACGACQVCCDGALVCGFVCAILTFPKALNSQPSIQTSKQIPRQPTLANVQTHTYISTPAKAGEYKLYAISLFHFHTRTHTYAYIHTYVVVLLFRLLATLRWTLQSAILLRPCSGNGNVTSYRAEVPMRWL